MPQIRLVAIEDETLLRLLLTKELGSDERFQILAEAGDGESGLEACREHKPDVVLLDICIPGFNGIYVARQLISEFPNMKIIAISAIQDISMVMEVIDTGVHGFVDKRQAVEVLKAAICSVMEGHRYFSKSIMELLIRQNRNFRTPQKQLTNREWEILKHVAEGKTSRAIAIDLGISEATVKSHRYHLTQKLGIHDVAGLTRYAIKYGILPPANS